MLDDRHESAPDAVAPDAVARAGVLRPASDAGLLAWAVKAAAVDGAVDPTERSVLQTLASQRGVPPEQLEQMIEAALRNDMDVPEPASRAEAEAWLRAMATIALADGQITNEELSLLRMLGTKFDLGESDVKMLLKRLRGEQYTQAAAALRDGPQPPSFN